jgi:CheY-like chemotaxis protein
VHLRATTTARGEVRLAVADTGIGIGIEAEVMARLFRPFVQADESTTRRYGGSGLGLSICRALASEMGGRVGAESEPGRGSVFWVELPLAAGQPLALHPEAPSAATPEDDDLSGMRVLLVEDNETNAVIATAMLSRWGVEVSAVDNGPAALELIDAEQGFDLVLMDLHMPGMSGRDAAAALRTRHSPEALPIVALTAAAFEEDRERCLGVGMNDFVTKPISPERLRAVLVKWKGRRRGAVP